MRKTIVFGLTSLLSSSSGGCASMHSIAKTQDEIIVYAHDIPFRNRGTYDVVAAPEGNRCNLFFYETGPSPSSVFDWEDMYSSPSSGQVEFALELLDRYCPHGKIAHAPSQRNIYK